MQRADLTAQTYEAIRQRIRLLDLRTGEQIAVDAMTGGAAEAELLLFGLP